MKLNSSRPSVWKALFNPFRAESRELKMALPMTPEQIRELASRVTVFMATGEPTPANDERTAISSTWGDSPHAALKSLRQKAAEQGHESVWDVHQESRPFYEDHGITTIYRLHGVA